MVMQSCSIPGGSYSYTLPGDTFSEQRMIFGALYDDVFLFPNGLFTMLKLTQVNVPERAAANLPAQPVFVSNSQLHLYFALEKEN